MAKKYVKFIRDHVHVIPATVLETRLISGGPVVQSIPVPEEKYSYSEGTVAEFRSKKDAIAFAKAMNGAAVLVD